VGGLQPRARNGDRSRTGSGRFKGQWWKRKTTGGGIQSLPVSKAKKKTPKVREAAIKNLGGHWGLEKKRQILDGPISSECGEEKRQNGGGGSYMLNADQSEETGFAVEGARCGRTVSDDSEKAGSQTCDGTLRGPSKREQET